MDFAGKRFWVTGASSGIGAGLARALGAEGATVILSGRNRAGLEAVAADVPHHELLPFEATDYDALPGVVAAAGHVDCLVNNAGIGARSPAAETAFEVYKRVMEVDFFAPLRLTQLVLPAMRARRSGHIAAVGSLSGKFGNPGATAYCSAKFALTGFMESLRSEVVHDGVQVTVIAPGFVRTEISRHSLKGDGTAHNAEPADRGISADEAAQQILAGLRAGKREIPVGGGPEMAVLELMRRDPEAVYDLMAQMGKPAA